MRYWILAMGLFLAGFLIVSEPAFAHSSDGAPHTVLDLNASEPDPKHVGKGHSGHCHGGSFCNGFAMTVVPSTAPQLASKIDRQIIPPGCFRILPVVAFDPPPPRLMS